jgi:hypothetical protein
MEESSLIYEISYAIDNVCDNYNPCLNIMSYGIGRTFAYHIPPDIYDIAYDVIQDYGDEISLHSIHKSHIIFNHINNFHIIVLIIPSPSNNEFDIYVRANKFIKRLHKDIKFIKSF